MVPMGGAEARLLASEQASGADSVPGLLEIEAGNDPRSLPLAPRPSAPLQQYGVSLLRDSSVPGQRNTLPRSETCLALNCGLPLTTPYTKRCHLCMPCMRAASVVIACDGEGLLSHRFCQRCHRTHLIVEFQGDKHSCTEMLERFNSKRRDLRRKRKEQEEGQRPEEPPAPWTSSSGSGAAAAPRRAPSSPISTSGALLEQQGEEENMQWLASSGLLDALWTEGWEAADPGRAFAPGPAARAAQAGSGYGLGLAEETMTVHVKLPEAGAESATALPPVGALGSTLLGLLPFGSSLVGASLRPGCLILTFDVLLPGGSGAPGPEGDARKATALAATLQRALLGLRCAAGARLYVRDAEAALGGESGRGAPPPAPRPAPPRLTVGAVLLPAREAVALPLAAPLAEGLACVARAGGAVLPVSVQPGQLLLRRCDELSTPEAAGGGARGELLLVEAQAESDPGLLSLSDPVPLLLSTNARLVAELNAKAAARAAAGRGLSEEVMTLACALLAGAKLRLRCRAATVCLRLGWVAALEELLGAPPPLLEGDAALDALALASFVLSVQQKLSAAARASGGAAVAQAETGRRAMAAAGWAAVLSTSGWGAQKGDGSGSAMQHAGALMRRANTEQGHCVPLLAACAALEDAQRAAAAGCWREAATLCFLRASIRILYLDADHREDRPPPATTAAAAAATAAPVAEKPGAAAAAEAESAEARRRSLDVFFALENMMSWVFTAAMMASANVALLWNCIRLVLRREGLGYPAAAQLLATQPYSGYVLESLRLHPLPQGAPYKVEAVPWSDAVAHTRRYFWLTLALMLPANAALLGLAMRLLLGRVPLRYNLLFCALACADALSYALIDWHAWRATGALLVWPFNPATLGNALGCIVLFLRGPFSQPRYVWAYMLTRLLSVNAAVLLLKPALLLQRAGAPYLVQSLAMGYTMWNARRAHAAVEAAHTRHMEKQRVERELPMMK